MDGTQQRVTDGLNQLETRVKALEATTMESEALKMARVHLETVKVLKGAEGWQVLGEGLARIASLVEADQARSQARNYGASMPAPNEHGPTDEQLRKVQQLVSIAKTVYGDFNPEDGLRKAKALVDELAPRA